MAMKNNSGRELQPYALKKYKLQLKYNLAIHTLSAFSKQSMHKKNKLRFSQTSYHR